MLLMLLLAMTPAMAERDNPYGIDDDCYRIYDEARKYRNSPICLEYSKSIINLARQKGDDLAICAALCIPQQYYFYYGTEEQFFKSLEDLRKHAKDAGADMYYYWCFTEEIRYYLRTNRSFKALNKVNDYMKELQKNKLEEQTRSYAQFACYTALGEVYTARRDEVHARESFLKALEESKNIPRNLDEASVYIELARITEVGNTDERRMYLKTALDKSATPTDSASALMGLGYLASNQNDVQQFSKLYAQYKPILSREGLSVLRYDKWYKSNEAFRMELEQKPDSANIMRQSIKDPLMRFQALSDYYSAVGDDKLTIAYLDSIVTYLRSSQAEQNIADVAEINTVYETDMLKMETETVRQQGGRTIMIILLVVTLIVIAVLTAWLIRRRKMLQRLKAMSDELRVARDEAVKANRMKDTFIQNMSHEVRTPLNAVTGFAQLLALPGELFTEEERQEFSEHIQNNTNLLTMLIDDILNVSDMESGKYHMTFDNYRINEICRTAISAVQYRVQETVELIFVTDVEDERELYTDARRVQQVLINYLTNAIKHTTEGSITLSVSLTENPGKITFAVADTGTGVPGDKSEDIFKRFEKLDVFVQGTGLGLNICSVISQKLNGTVRLDTTYPEQYDGVEHGARFVFILPEVKTEVPQLPLETIK